MASYSATHQLLCVQLVNLNAVGDTAVNVPFSKFAVTAFRVSNASVDLSTSAATLGLYTAPAAGGTAIVTPATGVVTPLSAASIVNPATIASTATTGGTVVSPQARQIYIRVGVAHGSAATATVQIELQRWP